jgi:hypothetical protein
MDAAATLFRRCFDGRDPRWESRVSAAEERPSLIISCKNSENSGISCGAGPL